MHPLENREITISSCKSFADILKTTNESSKESDSHTDDSSSSHESDTVSQHLQSRSGGVLVITGSEESLDVYHSDIRLTS